MKILLETSIAEYGVAVADGQIVEQAEFQDGLAFVVRAQQILDTISTAEIGSDVVLTMDEALDAVQEVYDTTADPSDVESATMAVIDAINRVLGITDEEITLNTYITNIRNILEARTEYQAGNL